MGNGRKKLKKSTKVIIGIISVLIITMVLGILLLFNSIKVNDNVLNYLNKFQEYVESGEYDKARDILKKAEDLKSTKKGKENLELMDKIEKSEKLFDEATNLMKREKFDEAKDKLNKILANEGKIYKDAQEKIKECDEKLVEINFQKAKDAFYDGDYDSALESISDVLDVKPDDEEAKELQASIIENRDAKLAREESERKKQEEEEKKEREAFTEEEAVEFLKGKLGSNSNSSLEVESYEEIDDRSGYLIKVEEKKFGFIATSKWYFVDKHNKEAFEWNMSDDTFVELN